MVNMSQHMERDYGLEKDDKISNSVIRRLPVYLRHVQTLRAAGIQTISSQQMGVQLDMNPAQIRKDFAYFGEFGRKGVGYDIEYLEHMLLQILHLDRQIGVALVGAGHLGIALSNYARFQSERITIMALFDNDPVKIGTHIGDLIVQDMKFLREQCHDRNIEMGIIAVPAAVAQDVCDRLVEGQVRVILNFAPTNLRVPKHVILRTTDFTTELQALAYYIAR